MDKRKQEILCRIVEDFIKTGIPVGSEVLYHNYKWGIKSATIRKEMAGMEKMGYLTHSYTSSGRTPTDKGYRFYVDILLQNKSIEDEKWEIQKYNQKYNFSLSQEIEEVIEKAVKLLVEITKYIVFISSPQISKEVFKHIELILLQPKKVLAVIITNTGLVYKKVFSVPEIVTANMLEKISRILNNKLSGLTFEKIMLSSLVEVEEEIISYTNLFKKVTRDLINQILTIQKEEEIQWEGTEHLLVQTEFKNIEKLQKILNFTAEKKLLYNYLKETLGNASDEIKVLIGEENKYKEMEECSLIVTNYKLNPRNYGIIAVLGPKRMYYSRAIAGARFISNILNNTLSQMTWAGR